MKGFSYIIDLSIAFIPRIFFNYIIVVRFKVQYASACTNVRCILHETLTPTVLGRNPASNISPSFRKTAKLKNKFCFAAALQLLSSLV